MDRGFSLTALLRSDDSRAAELRARGVETVFGTLDSVELIKKHSKRSDIVFTGAVNSHLPSVEAVLAGFEEKKAKSGTVGVLIYVSGTGVFADGDRQGLPPGEDAKVYSDDDIAAIETLGSAHPQRKVHIKLVAAAEAGHVRSYIVLPSTVFGISSSTGVSSSFNQHSNQMPALIRGSIRKGQAGLVGRYENTWPLVHIDDLISLFETIFNAALAKRDKLALTALAPGLGLEA